MLVRVGVGCVDSNGSVLLYKVDARIGARLVAV